MDHLHCSYCSVIAVAPNTDRYRNSVVFLPIKDQSGRKVITFLPYKHMTNAQITPEMLGKITVDAVQYLRDRGIYDYMVAAMCSPGRENEHASVYVTIPAEYAFVPALLPMPAPTDDSGTAEPAAAC